MTPAQSTGFDISALTTDQQQITHDIDLIFNSDGDAVTGLRIVGKNSPEYQAAQTEARIESIQKAGRRKAPLDTSTEDGATTWARQLVGVETKLAVAVVVGWYGFTKDGQDLPFDKEVVRAMFKKYPTWREKVSAALENDGNFIKG